MKRLGDLKAAIRSDKPTLTRYREIRGDRMILSELLTESVRDSDDNSTEGQHE